MSPAHNDIDDALMAVTSVDGRYRSKVSSLRHYFSEFALIRYRVMVEIEWYLSLGENLVFDGIAPVGADTERKLRAIYAGFTVDDARRVKELEATTSHDVKAVEYFLKGRFEEIDAGLPLEMIHFACTSEDISNLAYALILRDFANRELEPRLRGAIAAIAVLARRYKSTPMLSRTHGQAASPTTVGKELAIFAARLERQRSQLERQEYLGKLNGAVGNFNAHQFAYPEVDWIDHSRAFVERLGLAWNPLTSQIESHDFLAELFDVMVRIDTILLDFCRDVWGYISLGYFTQRAQPGEVGSSTMPHKVNPIDFENCEGNVGLATALFQHLAVKLPVSRWQRDLSDSTAMRAIGSAFAHVMIALGSLDRGLQKIEVNEARIAADLGGGQSWEVVAEAIQTLMRRYGLPRPYETLKELTRGRPITREVIAEFVSSLPLNESAKASLSRLTPQNYVGLAAELVERFTPGGKGG
jgi:adenylosuccinate lyase